MTLLCHVSLQSVLVVVAVDTSEDDGSILQPRVCPYGTVGRSVGRSVGRKCTVNRYLNFPLRACTVFHTGVYNKTYVYPLVTTRSIALSSDTIQVSIWQWTLNCQVRTAENIAQLHPTQRGLWESQYGDAVAYPHPLWPSVPRYKQVPVLFFITLLLLCCRSITLFFCFVFRSLRYCINGDCPPTFKLVSCGGGEGGEVCDLWHMKAVSHWRVSGRNSKTWNVRDGIDFWWLIDSSIVQRIGFSCKATEFWKLVMTGKKANICKEEVPDYYKYSDDIYPQILSIKTRKQQWKNGP